MPTFSALAAVLIMVLGVAPVRASAAPKVVLPTSAQITAKGIEGGKLEVKQADRPELFQMLMSEVSWLATATPQTTAPKADKLGAKYTVTLYVKNAPQQVYDLYPLAVGGPRAFRPAKQPGGRKAEGWFYGRLTMSETLRFAGAPLEARPDLINGGIGGGTGENVAAEVDPLKTVDTFLADLRRLFLLNGAILVVILFGLAGISFLIRRRV